jgi:hypothetical protein
VALALLVPRREAAREPEGERIKVDHRDESEGVERAKSDRDDEDLEEIEDDDIVEIADA